MVMYEMELLYFLLIWISCFQPSRSSIQGNLSMPEVSLDFSAMTSDESESELSSQLQEIDERSSGWSAWSEWSACSRSCDGGVSHQLRTCKIGPCKGIHVRYKICHMQFVVALFAILATANAGLLVGPSARIIQGPSTRTTVVGPDGSAISAVAPGGQIVQEESLGVVAHTAPVLAAAPIVSAYSAPLVSAAPVVSAYSAPLVSGVVGHSLANTIVAGPSGTIATGRTLAAAPVLSAW